MKEQIAVASQWEREPISVKASEEEGEIGNCFTEIHDAVARRAYEIFETEGHQSGHELEHWLKAEAEILYQSHFQITEKEDALTVRAEVPGFSAKDLEVHLEPQRFVISAKRETDDEHKDGEKLIFFGNCASQLLRIGDLPSRIVAKKANATLENGVLELRLPKAAKAREASSKAQTA